MNNPDKITILLADEDALRRDGLAAVLEGTAKFEVIAHCPDGEAALDRMRELHPDVAVVDLNLPKLHGIELVRRVRGEALGTKIVILAGTTDNEIIREVVRAGGDAYLLKNGPARHLIDAISYVRDGGQYFSPQLRRDGLDRHLLQETPRVPPPGRAARGSEAEAEDEVKRGAESENGVESRGAREGRQSKTRRPVRRPAEGKRLRERLREEPEAGHLAERDYEILDMMADGIKPILDRLDEIDARVNQMETGDEPVPRDVRNWLSAQMADTFRDPRAGMRDPALGRNVQEIEARLPEMIEQAVNARFHQMAEKLQKDIEDTHVRTLETFVKNIQVKLVQRVAALETGMSRQAEAMHQLREYSQRTEDNLSRLLMGVDKLAQELPKRLQAPAEAAPTEAAAAPAPPKKLRRKTSRARLPILIWAVAAVAVLAAVGYHFYQGRANTAEGDGAAAVAQGGSGAVKSGGKPPGISAGTDTKTKMQAAEQYVERKEYSPAEDIYKQVLQSEPNNVDAMKALASVLYREDKIEESAAILDKLPRN
jgi:DNA-binding NarL/FixJ family response regulator/tetratricopeptide (TPR) repeat protein